MSSRNFVQSQNAVNPFPLRYNARLTYGVNVTLTTIGSGSVNAAKFTMSLNSLYDPEVSSTGHQPYQFDQLTAIYLEYLATNAYVDITFTDPTIDGLWVGWIVRASTDAGDNLTSTDLGRAMERPNLRVFPLNNTGAQNVSCKMRVPLHQVFGLSAAQYASQFPIFGAQYNFDPTTQAYLDLLLFDPTGNVAAQSVRAVGRVVYDTQFWNYNAPSAS